MSDKERFDFESIQDLQTVQKCLRALTEGFESGRLSFASEGQEIVLHPTPLLKIKIRARMDGDKSRLTIKMSWKKTQMGKTNKELRIGS